CETGRRTRSAQRPARSLGLSTAYCLALCAVRDVGVFRHPSPGGRRHLDRSQPVFSLRPSVGAAANLRSLWSGLFWYLGERAVAGQLSVSRRLADWRRVARQPVSRTCHSFPNDLETLRYFAYPL